MLTAIKCLFYKFVAAKLKLEFVSNKRSTLIATASVFNVRYSNWFNNDTDNTLGSKINFIRTIYGLTQMINESRYMLPNRY